MRQKQAFKNIKILKYDSIRRAEMSVECGIYPPMCGISGMCSV